MEGCLTLLSIDFTLPSEDMSTILNHAVSILHPEYNTHVVDFPVVDALGNVILRSFYLFLYKY